MLFQDMYYVMCQNGNLWHNLLGKRIFITGCSGFIGNWMVETFAFANKGLGLKAEMVGLCRRPYYANAEGLSIIQGDVRDFEFPDGHFDYIIHAAGGRGKDTFQTSVQGTERVIEFARHCGAKRIVFTSSGAVYGADPLNPDHAYGEGKRAAEMLLTMSDLDFRTARIFTIVGPGMDMEKYALGKFIKEGCDGGPVMLKGGENVTRSYLYAADLACSLWMMLLFDGGARVYDVGSCQRVTIAEVAAMVAEACGVALEREEGECPDSVYVPPESPYLPNIGLRDAIERTMAWYKEDKKEKESEGR